MKKCLIVTYSFPPVNRISAKRYGEMAPYMRDYNWEPYILTTKSTGTLKVNLHEDMIIRVGHHTQNMEKKKFNSAWLQQAIKRANFLSNMSAIDNTVYNWFFKNYRELLSVTKNIPFDLVVSSYGPASALCTGLLISKAKNVPWVIDYRDPSSIGSQVSGIVKSIDIFVDKLITKKADRVITVSPYLASLLSIFYKQDVEVVYNGFDENITSNYINKNYNNEELIAYYSGSFYNYRLPAVYLFIDAMSKINDAIKLKLFIRSTGPDYINELIMQYAERQGVLKNIIFNEPADNDVVLDEQKSSDILMVFEDVNGLTTYGRGIITGKVYEYLTSTAPVIAIAREDSDIASILSKTKRGCVLSDVHNIVKAITAISKQQFPKTTRNCEEISFYSRKNQCKLLCDIMDDVVKHYSP